MKLKQTLTVIIIFGLISCEGIIGEDGVVVDMETGERLVNVHVRMESDTGDVVEDVTDSTGYFKVTKLVGCISDCEDYWLSFEKDGFQQTVIDEHYFRDPDTEFVTENAKDTLIVKLLPN